MIRDRLELSTFRFQADSPSFPNRHGLYRARLVGRATRRMAATIQWFTRTWMTVVLPEGNRDAVERPARLHRCYDHE